MQTADVGMNRLVKSLYQYVSASALRRNIFISFSLPIQSFGDNRIYDEINDIMTKEFERACRILQDKRCVMDALCEQLLAKNTIEHSEIRDFFENGNT